MKIPKTSGSTIPYHLRPHKAIERNLFIALLRRLNNVNGIDLSNYRYVGFGAPFLEDFKVMHIELGINDMHCIEYDTHAHSRQVFNNPYRFLSLFESSSTDYISSENFLQDKNQIIWFDFAAPKQFRQQLNDIELLCQKVGKLDILKFTFNSTLHSFVTSHGVSGGLPPKPNKVLKFLLEDATYQNYLPEKLSVAQISNNFPSVIRAMALRAAERGLAKAESDYRFNHIVAFNYADGQLMTTITGIIETREVYKDFLKQSAIDKWEFYEPESPDEFINGNDISVPAMTVSERLEIDRKIPVKNVKEIVKELSFYYGADSDEHLKLMEGYCRYYKFLPYYSKVIY